MKNLAQLCLLAALAAVPSLAADLSPHPPSKAVPQPTGSLNFESLYPGIIPATDVTGLGKRQNTCASSNSYPCVNVPGCCPVGTYCGGDSIKAWCCPNGKICDPSISYCPAGETDCTDIIGVSGCCPTATHKCAISGGTAGCARLSTSGGSSDICDPGAHLCSDGVFCCPNGSTCITGTGLCLMEECEAGWTQCSFGGCCDPGYACDPATKLCRRSGGGGVSVKSSTIPKPTRSSSKALFSTKSTVTPSTTLDDPFTSISIRPTTTTTSSEPTPPPKSESESPSNDVVPPETSTSTASSSSIQTASSSSIQTPSSSFIQTAPSSGGNALKPGAWSGGFGIAFFVFFHL